MPVNELRKNDYFVYAQDEYKWRPNLTLNLGVRYTIFDLFDEANGMANPFDFATCGPQGFCGVGASFGQQNYGDVDPRVGFAWTPWKDGRTVIRGGFGIYHEDGQLDDQNLPAKNEVPSYSATGSSNSPLSYPVAFGAGTLSPNAEQRDRKDTYVEQWSFSAQRELPADFVGTVSYLGSHGVHLLETNVVNLIDPATGLAQYPAFAPAIGWRGSIGMSTYNGLSVAMRRSFSRGLLVTANYMWSHEIDNGSNGSGDGDEVSPQNAIVPGLRSRQRHLGRPPCGQWQCGLSAPLRPGQADAESARNCKRHRRQVGVDHDRTGSHRLPGECADAQQLHRAGWELRHAAPRFGSRRFSYSAGRQNGGGVDQSSGLCHAGRRVRHRAARPGSRAGHLADRSRRQQRHFPAGERGRSSSARSSTTSSITRSWVSRSPHFNPSNVPRGSAASSIR